MIHTNYLCLSSAACGGTLSDGNGTITSPSYPSNYPKNKECTWKIIGPKGQRISLKFKDFKLEGSANGVSIRSNYPLKHCHFNENHTK